MSTLPTYRDQAELSAQAFQRLVGGLPVPEDPAAVRRLVECRDIVVGSLIDRLPVLGLVPRASTTGLISTSADPRRLVHRVRNVLVSMPRISPEQRRAPSDVLDGAATVTAVDLWRNAARYVTSATATLTESSSRPWETDDGAAWWLMRDLATLTEAVVVVDADLEQLGILNDLTASPHAMPRELQRMSAAQCARVASWYATSDAPETAGRRDRGWDRGQPRPVERPADLAAAQRLLAGYLRPPHPNSAAFNANTPVIALGSVRAAVRTQQSSVRTALEWAETLPDCGALAVALREGRDLLDQLAAQLPSTHERVRVMPPRHTMYQAKELADAVRRFHVQGRLEGTPPVSTDDLAKWARGLHETSVSLGLAVRGEMRRAESNFGYRSGLGDVEPFPGHRPPLDHAADALVKAAPPPPGPARWVGPAERNTLAQMLNETPTPGRRSPGFPRVSEPRHQGGLDR